MKCVDTVGKSGTSSHLATGPQSTKQKFKLKYATNSFSMVLMSRFKSLYPSRISSSSAPLCFRGCFFNLSLWSGSSPKSARYLQRPSREQKGQIKKQKLEKKMISIPPPFRWISISNERGGDSNDLAPVKASQLERPIKESAFFRWPHRIWSARCWTSGPSSNVSRCQA